MARLESLCLLLLATPCSAQKIEDQPELSRHAASLASKRSKPIGENSEKRLENLRALKIEPNRAKITSHVTSIGFDFLRRPAILAVIDRTTLDADAQEPAPYQVGALAPLPYRVPFNRVHILGQELTRIWPLACDAGRGDEAALRAYAERVHDCIEHPEILAGSYMGIAHWIPQFLWIGMWLSLGAP